MSTSIQYASYANVTLPVPTTEIESIITRTLPIQIEKIFGLGFRSPSHYVHKLPVASSPEIPDLPLGTLHWPIGATHPAWFYTVVNGTILQKIEANIGPVLSPKPLTLFDGRSGKIITAQMYLLPPVPLNQLGDFHHDGWLICLTDVRFFWYWKRGKITQKPDSWLQLYYQIANILGVSITIDPIHPDYQTPSIKWVGEYAAGGILLDAVAKQLNQVVVVNLNGSVRIRNWNTARIDAMSFPLKGKRVLGGYLKQETLLRYNPEKVVTLFVDQSQPSIPSSPYQIETTFESLRPQFPIIQATAFPGYQEILHSDYPYTGKNLGQITRYATTASRDWYGWQLENFNITLAGIEPYQPTGWEHVIQWMLRGEKNPVVATRILKGPLLTMPSGNWFAGLDHLVHPYPSGVDDPGAIYCEEGCGWFAGMATGWCLKASVVGAWGQCSTINTDQEFLLRYSTSENLWISQSWNGSAWVNENFLYNSGQGPLRVWLDYATQPGIAASINNINLMLNCCGDKTAIFEGGPLLSPAFCTGAVPSPCSPNTFRILLECACCPISGWDGPGYYCIENTGPNDCIAVELLESDQCDSGIKICSGPYPTLADAQAVCPPSSGITTPCCGNDPIPQSLCLTITSGSFSDFTSISGSYNLYWNPNHEQWEWSGSFAPGKFGSFTFKCVGTSWYLFVDSDWLSCGASNFSTVVSCNPANISFIIVSTCVSLNGTITTGPCSPPPPSPPPPPPPSPPPPPPQPPPPPPPPQ